MARFHLRGDKGGELRGQRGRNSRFGGHGSRVGMKGSYPSCSSIVVD
jgi:hypothetical protein